VNDINELHWTYHHDFGVPDTRLVRAPAAVADRLARNLGRDTGHALGDGYNIHVECGLEVETYWLDAETGEMRTSA
jgi:hypothetical protein